MQTAAPLDYLLDVKQQHSVVSIGNNACHRWSNPLTCPGWELLRSETEVTVGDVFKLSHHILKVLDIRTTPIAQPGVQQEICSAKVLNPSPDSSCRVCYDSSSTEDNPILSPCRCQGSIQYIHLNCLREWILKSGGYSSTTSGLRVRKGSMMCSVCKHPYSSGLFRKRSGLADIFLQDKVQLPYIKLEVLSQSENDDNFIIVESLSRTEPVAIGRSSECHIKMGLDHLSRRHCQLRFYNGKVLIKDTDSSFGTLRFLQQPAFTLQIGNKLVCVTASLEKKKVLKMSKTSKRDCREFRQLDSFPELDSVFGVDAAKDLHRCELSRDSKQQIGARVVPRMSSGNYPFRRPTADRRQPES